MKFLFTVFMIFFTLYANTINLTKEELKYISTHKTIKVHNELGWAPYNYNENGKPIGFSIDYMNLVASKAGLHVKYISGPTWGEFMQMLENNEIDVMLNIAKTKDRENKFNFTTPYVKSIAAVFTLEQNKKYKVLNDFNGKRLAIVKGFYEEALLKKDYPKIKLLLVDSSINILKTVAFGKADGGILNLGVGNYLLEENGITSVKSAFNIASKKFNLNLHLATNKNNVVLRNILEKAKNLISEEELNKIKIKFFGKVLSKDDNILQNLTKKQKDYIRTHKVIRMCNNPNVKPLEFAKDGNMSNMSGIAIDTLHIIEKKLNVKFKNIPTSSWSQSQEFLKNKKCDILPLAIQNTKRSKYANFTRPYLKLPLAIFTHKNIGSIAVTLDDISTQTMARRKGSGIIPILKEKYPNLKIIETSSALESLQAVNDGRVYFTIDMIPVALDVINNYVLNNIRISGYTNFIYNLSIAVRNDDLMLLGILDKTLGTITKKEHKDIYDNWVHTNIVKNIDYSYFYIGISFILVILFIFIYWNQKLRVNTKEKNDLIERFNLALNIAKIGTFELDMISNDIQWNEENHKIFGTDKNNFKPNIEKFMKFIPDYEKENMQKIIDEAILSKKSVYIKHYIKRGDGKLRFVLENLKIIDFDTSGKPLKMIGTLLDITEQNKLEENLIKAKEKAEESTKEKSIFLANMSHEIRTPMNSILGMSHLISETNLDEKQHDFIKKIQQASKNLIEVINDILDFSKIEAKKMKIENVEFDMNDIILNVRNLIEFKAYEKDLKFNIYYDDKNSMFKGDALRISQILINLLANAVKFTQNGEISLNLSYLKNNVVRFSIKDTGIGISEEKKVKLFEAFSQADESTTRKYGGTGLGLTISKELVLLMGGKIWVNSILGKGSEFVFELRLPKVIINKKIIDIKHEKILHAKIDELFLSLKEAAKTKRPKNCENIMDEIKNYILSKEDKALFDELKSLLKKYKFNEIINTLELKI